MGSLEIIIGPMFSGKTSRLINRYNEILNEQTDAFPERKIFTINYDKDTRYSTNKIVSHDGISLNCNFVHLLENIYICPEMLSKLNNAQYIFIDEAQFFNDLDTWVLFQVQIKNKHIVVSGLDSDFNRNKFGKILDLIPHADKINKLTGTCSKCSQPSIYTHRISDETQQEVIGNKNYIPVCRTCYCDLNKDRLMGKL